MSIFNTENIESTTGGAINFGQGLNVSGTDIKSLINMTEYYSQEIEPSSPSNGAVWVNGYTVYQYVGGAWRILSVPSFAAPPPPPTILYGSRGVFGGGSSINGTVNVIDYITIATPSNAIDFGDLTVAREQLAACSDGSRGVFGGG
jgi:hypothetical protein